MHEPRKIVPNQLPPECDEEAKFDAMRLIQMGNRNGDELTKKIGQARLRVMEDRATEEDFEILGIKFD